MKIRITREAPWTIKDRLRTFREGEVLDIGTDVPDAVGQEMLIYGYAEPVSTKNNLVQETKVHLQEETKTDDTVSVQKPRGRPAKATKKE